MNEASQCPNCECLTTALAERDAENARLKEERTANAPYAEFGRYLHDMAESHLEARDECERTDDDVKAAQMADAYIKVWRKQRSEIERLTAALAPAPPEKP